MQEFYINLQGSAIRLRPGLVKFVPSVDYHFCLYLPAIHKTYPKHISQALYIPLDLLIANIIMPGDEGFTAQLVTEPDTEMRQG